METTSKPRVHKERETGQWVIEVSSARYAASSWLMALDVAVHWAELAAWEKELLRSHDAACTCDVCLGIR